MRRLRRSLHFILTVAWRDITSKLRKPGFYAVTLLLPLFPMGMVLLLGDSTSSAQVLDDIGVTGEVQQSWPNIGVLDRSGVLDPLGATLPVTGVQRVEQEQQGRAALEQRAIEVLYILPEDYRSTGVVQALTPDERRSAASVGLTSLRQLVRQALAPDIDRQVLDRLLSGMEVRALATNPALRAQERDDQAWLLPAAFTMIFSLAAFSSSSMMLQSISEEKESRVIEVLLSSIAPRQLLIGKVLGLGLLGTLQLLIWMGLSRLVLGYGSSALLLLRDVTVPAVLWALAGMYFVLNYLLYALLLAGVGAISASLRETSQLATAITMPALAPILLIPGTIADPDSGIAVFTSIFPLTAGVIMLLRQSLMVVPLWQVALSLGLMALSVALIGSLVSRLFRASTLLSGKTLSLRELRRALFD